MIQPNELRIGNYVTWCAYDYDGIADKFINKEVCLSEKDFITLLQNNDFDKLMPIPITEERLVELGFEKEGKFYMRIAIGEWNFIYVDIRDFKYAYTGWPLAEEGIPFKAEYVHRIQNVFFVFTGEELTIKELQK